MTNEFAAKIIRAAGALGIACLLATSAGAQDVQRPDMPRMITVFFDIESATLSSEAKTIVLKAVDAAERGQATRIALAAFAAPDESERDPLLAAHRAAAVKQQIAEYGYQGLVIVDEEAPEPPLFGVGNEIIRRSAILHLGN